MQVAASTSDAEPGIEESDTQKFPIPVIGDYVALRCFKYKDYLPQIGRLSSINDTTVEIEWLDGSYSGIWVYWKHRGKLISETFPRRALVGAINLSASMRLKSETVTSLKQVYQETE